MFEPKPISAGGVPGALQKAERYRLLNDPKAAESICLDILEVEPDNPAALVMLILARTDQFGEASGASAAKAREVLPRLKDAYQRSYYTGVIHERRAKALLNSGRPGSGSMAYAGFREAMECYGEAEALSTPGNDEARLRWNTCARILNESPNLAPRGEERFEPSLGE
jgi:hypothetical protein